MKISIGNGTKSILDSFVRTQHDKTIAYLKANFTISDDDCEDIFQDSFIILHRNIQDGKLDKLTSSVSTYFMAICRNKTLELLRSKRKYVSKVSEPRFNDDRSIDFATDKVESILMLDSDDYAAVEEKEALVRKIVMDLPTPCNELLWGYYRDGLTMKTLAKKFNYASENAVKVTKHRCCEKFRIRFNDLLKQLF